MDRKRQICTGHDVPVSPKIKQAERGGKEKMEREEKKLSSLEWKKKAIDTHVSQPCQFLSFFFNFLLKKEKDKERTSD